ncbi:MAG: hypothetical protein QUT30_05755 [Acidobacteriota bacterium]|nr:hypothetical protein [Acidobacteriota bacterium]
MSEDKSLFDANRQMEFKLQSAEGAKTVTVRFPSDQQWMERQRKRKILIKNLGRGMSETIMPDSSDFDAGLVAELRVGEEPAIDAFEAGRILDELSRADVDNIEREGNLFRVHLQVPGSRTIHVLKIPSSRDLFQHRRSFYRIIDLPYNRQQLTINLDAAADLYKKLCESNEGYAASVPIIHQAAVVQALVNEVESGSGVAGSENF